MSLYWYACISMNTDFYMICDILLETIWWALSSLIMWICPVIHEILANKDFTVTDDLISQLFVVAFVHPTYVQIALIWGFSVQLICENWSTGCGDTSWIKFVTLPLLLVQALLRRVICFFGVFWRFSWSFYFAFSRFSSYSYIFSSWLNLFY